jgi:arginine/lysine/ornithine decarboxylase
VAELGRSRGLWGWGGALHGGFGHGGAVVLADGLVGTHGVTAMDPMRVTVDVSALGISGFAVERALDERFAVSAELAQPRCVTFVFSGGNSDEDVRALVGGLARLVRELEVTEGAGERCALTMHAYA